MSLIVKALHRFDRQSPPDGRGLSQDRLARLRMFHAGSTACPAGCAAGSASWFCDSLLQSTFVRKYPATRIAWVLVGMMTILVFTTLNRPVSQIKAGIADPKAPDQSRASAAPVVAAANTNTRDFQSSSRDLALPLSRHVLKFVPPPANQHRHRMIAKLPQPSTNEHAKAPVFNNQPATAVPYVAKMSKPRDFTDNNLIQTAPALQDPLVRLAAIACFDGRQRCTAVINGQTVRVGQTICGYTLVQIGSGEVLMQKDAKYLLLKMDHSN